MCTFFPYVYIHTFTTIYTYRIYLVYTYRYIYLQCIYILIYYICRCSPGLETSQTMGPVATDLRGMGLIGDALLTDCRAGNLLDIVVQVAKRHGDSCTGRTCWHSEAFELLAALEPGRWTVYGVIHGWESRVASLSFGPDSHFLPNLARSLDSFWAIRETCRGLGGISTGAGFLDFTTAVFNYRSALAWKRRHALMHRPQSNNCKLLKQLRANRFRPALCRFKACRLHRVHSYTKREV